MYGLARVSIYSHGRAGISRGTPESLWYIP